MFHEYSSTVTRKRPPEDVTIPRVAKGGAANPCTRAAQLTQARTNSGASAEVERAEIARFENNKNRAPYIPEERTVGSNRRTTTRKSCRFFAPAIGDLIFFQNSFLC